MTANYLLIAAVCFGVFVKFPKHVLTPGVKSFPAWLLGILSFMAGNPVAGCGFIAAGFGDFFLALEDKKWSFLAGMGSFAVSLIIFGYIFVGMFRPTILSWAFITNLFVAYYVMKNIWPNLSKTKLKVPSLAYMVVLLTACFLASGANFTVWIGCTLWFYGDCSISAGMFGNEKLSNKFDTTGIYIIGLFFIACGLL